jgi:UDP-glucose 4-epimerase
MKRSILVTGVSGFIGSRMALRAKQEGHQVFGASRSCAKSLTTALDLQVLTLDALNTIDYIPEVETIIHCATANDILSKDFNAGVSLSVIGTQNLLEAAKYAGVKNFVFLSTLQVYGAELNGIYDENSSVLCESSYALNHYFGEEVCRLHSKLFGMNVVVARPSNVYGTPDVSTINRETLVPMCFVAEVNRTNTITLLSSGKQARNFVSTDEVADTVLARIVDVPQGFSVLNVGTDWNCSIIKIAEMVAQTYRQKYGENVKIIVKSKTPSKENKFKIDSQLSHMRKSPQEAENYMRTTILNLFKKTSGVKYE